MPRQARGPDDAPKSLRVRYLVGLDHWQSEFVCLEHQGYARQKAIAWWRQRSRDPVPESAQHAVEIAENGGLAFTDKITVRSIAGEKYDRIVKHGILGPIPAPLPVVGPSDYDLEEVPF